MSGKPRNKAKAKATKKPVNKMTKYFCRKTNFQGFCLSKCSYESSIKDYVFVPKNYGVNAWRDNKICSSCMLKPCIMLEYLDEVIIEGRKNHKARELAILAGKKGRETCPLNAIEKTKTYVKHLLRKHFGRKYVSELATIPPCIAAEVDTYTPEWYHCSDLLERDILEDSESTSGSSSASGSSSDEEFEFVN